MLRSRGGVSSLDGEAGSSSRNKCLVACGAVSAKKRVASKVTVPKSLSANRALAVSAVVVVASVVRERKAFTAFSTRK